ncbi:hypothetical protein BC830DRAFT_1113658 [Chytriomyces sp. MP71]|nr:hypothetical protein BC830DRAFT_1113658 [Chytriomyces sp. MP71]
MRLLSRFLKKALFATQCGPRSLRRRSKASGSSASLSPCLESLVTVVVFAFLLSNAVHFTFEVAHSGAFKPSVPRHVWGHVNASDPPPFPGHSLVSLRSVIDGKVSLKFDVADPVYSEDYDPEAHCSAPRLAIIGIFTGLGPEEAVRRTYLRHKYQQMNAKLPPHLQIDTMFLFPRPVDSKDASFQVNKIQVDLEKSGHPLTTVVRTKTTGRGNWEDTLEWVQIGRSLSYLPHPSRPHQWCQRYRFLGKSHDDAVIHLARFSRLLGDIVEADGVYNAEHVDVGREEKLHFVGKRDYEGLNASAPFLWAMSLQIAEWIHFSPVYGLQAEVLMDDYKMGKWLSKSSLNTQWSFNETEFHDYHTQNISSSSVVVHQCQSREAIVKCIDELL